MFWPTCLGDLNFFSNSSVSQAQRNSGSSARRQSAKEKSSGAEWLARAGWSGAVMTKGKSVDASLIARSSKSRRAHA
jgi:hypothetical protein